MSIAPSAPIQIDRKLVGLHGLRAVAAISVVTFHLEKIAKLTLAPPLAWVVGHFYLSVQLFFVLSAFSLLHSHTCTPAPLAGYFGKRFFRIAPLFYAMILFQIWRGGFPGWKMFLANIFFLFGLLPSYLYSINWAGWSVGVEMLFYVLLPALLFLAAKSNQQWRVFLAFFMISVMLSVIVWHLTRKFPANLPDQFSYYYFISNLAPFCAGLLAYAVYLKIKTGQLPTPGRRFLEVAFVLSFAMAFFDPLDFHWNIPAFYFAFWGIPFGILCVWQSIHPSRLLRSAIVQWLADRSFSIYLLHPVVIVYGKPIYSLLQGTGFLTGSWLYLAALAVTLPILLFCANLTYRLIELPGMRLGKRLTNRFAHE